MILLKWCSIVSYCFSIVLPCWPLCLLTWVVALLHDVAHQSHGPLRLLGVGLGLALLHAGLGEVVVPEEEVLRPGHEFEVESQRRSRVQRFSRGSREQERA
jgi:hypothetical protein